MSRYQRRLPVTVEAMQWDGSPESAAEIIAWCPEFHGAYPGPIDSNLQQGEVWSQRLGKMLAVWKGGWVIREPDGGFDTLGPVAFAESYEPAAPAAQCAEAIVARVRDECDRIEAEVYGQHDEDDDGKREAVARIRAVLDGPPPVVPADAEQVPCSTTVLRQFGGSPMFPHRPHPWAPQPGMTPVWCPGSTTPTEES